MSYVNVLKNVAKGAAMGVAAVTALPVFGSVGAITAAGLVVGSTLGAIATLADEFLSKNS